MYVWNCEPNWCKLFDVLGDECGGLCFLFYPFEGLTTKCEMSKAQNSNYASMHFGPLIYEFVKFGLICFKFHSPIHLKLEHFWCNHQPFGGPK